MRILFLFATAYILIAAVACQPLREAAAELEVSRKAYRKPRQPPKPPRHSTPKAKRRIEGISAASEAISDLFSRFRSRGGRLARKAAADVAQPGIDSYTRLKQHPSATLDGLTDPSRPESRFKPRIKPFRFKGDEAGYVADVDHDSLAAKPYKRPPLSAKLSTQAEAAGGQLQVDHTTASASEPNGQPAKHDGLFTDPKMAPYVAGVSVFSVIASWLLARTISQNTQQTDALNQATASSSANQQAVMQRAASVDAARQAAGSGRTEIRRRDLFAGDQAQQAADDSVRKRSVLPIIKPERAADNEGQRETLSKRIDPLQIMSSAAERTRTSIGSSASSFREALREYADDRRQFVGPLVALVLSALGLIGAIVYYEVKSEEISNELAANSTDRAGPSPSPPVLRLMNIEPLDEPSPVEDPENEQHSTKLRKRWNPVTAIRDCWQGTTIEDGRRVADEVVQNAPQSAKMLAVKYLTGVLAFFSVSAALLYYGYRGKSDSNSNSNSDPMPMPEPDNSKQPTVPSIPASEHRSSSQIRHTLLKKRSLVVDSTVPVLLPIAGAESSDRASKIDEEKTSQQSTSPHDQAEEEDEINSKGSSRRFLDAVQSQDLHKRMVRFPQVHRTTRTLADAGETAHEVSPKVYAALAVLSLLLVGSGVGAWAYHEYGDWHLDHTSLHKRSLNDEAEFGDATPVDHSNVERNHSKKLAQTLSKRDVINKMIRRSLMGGKKAYELAPRALKAAGTESNVAEIVPVSEIDSAEADHGVRAFDPTDIHMEAGHFKTSPTSSRSSASADDVKYARQHSKRVAGATLCASVLAAGGFDAVKNVVKHARKPGPDSSSSKSPVLLQVNKPVLNKQGNQDMQKRMMPMVLHHYWGTPVEHGTEALAEEVDEGDKAVVAAGILLASTVVVGVSAVLWYINRKQQTHDNHGPIHKRSTRMVDKRDLDALPPKSLQERAGFDGIEAGAREVSADIHIHRPEQSRTKEHQPAVVIHECDIDRESIQALAHWIRAADSLLSRAPRHLSKRMISRNAFNLAIADFKSLASKAQLTPAEQQARKHRLRKYGVFVGALAALDGVKTLVLYQVIKDYKENKRIRQQLQQVKQQQQQFSGYDEVRDSDAGYILSKRARIVPLHEIEVSAAVPIDHNPAYELWKQKVVHTMKLLGLVLGPYLTVIGIADEAKIDDGLYGEGRGEAELDAQKQRLAKRADHPNQGRLPMALMIAAVAVVTEGYKKYRDYRSRPRVYYFAPTQPTRTTRQRPRSESPFSAVK
ncbi:hypothetical protein NDA16_003208 [Ustilago loliicola]|nr:hypothetical protein NDA16_003208 [Ustilago loliicola]